MKKILAVSGGVDSMVMLDIFCRLFPKNELVVTHFDHGIRENSSQDAEFVVRKAREYGVISTLGKANLGESASEATAREARYKFLGEVAQKYDGEIYTAHHLDDLVASVTINLLRGTGWRGLAPMNTPGVKRPFLTEWQALGFDTVPDKARLLRYAGEKNLVFREDQTNAEDKYLRNRIYHRMNNGNVKHCLGQHLYSLWQEQLNVSAKINSCLDQILEGQNGPWGRRWFVENDDKTSLEILRKLLSDQGIEATRPQIMDFLVAIRTYAPAKRFNLPKDRMAKISKNYFNFE